VSMETGAQFTPDDVAQVVVSTVNAVLEAVNAGHAAEAAAVLRAEEATSHIDLVIRDLATGTTWGILLTFPPQNGPIVKVRPAPAQDHERERRLE
jgi:hypothetical protein